MNACFVPPTTPRIHTGMWTGLVVWCVYGTLVSNPGCIHHNPDQDQEA